jgi:hypothetical protein
MIEFNAKVSNSKCLFIDHPAAMAFLEKKKGQLVRIRISKPISKKTEQQNRALHGMITEWYKSGQHNAPEGLSFLEFRLWAKIHYGPEAYKMEYEGREVLVPKSVADYTKDEMINMIDLIKADIQETMRPLTPKMEEIFLGMEL